MITQHIPRLVTEEQNINLNNPSLRRKLTKWYRRCPMERPQAQMVSQWNSSNPDGKWSNMTFMGWWKTLIRLASILKVLNSTMITLIPKENEGRTPDLYKPIALCNVVYKLISKVISNRLKPLLPTLDFTGTAGFVEGRQIVDNVIHTHESDTHTKNPKERGDDNPT
jgi:hypothetical protein